jgi:hypothetical protein
MIDIILFTIGLILLLGSISCYRFLRECNRLEKLGMSEEDIMVLMLSGEWHY